MTDVRQQEERERRGGKGESGRGAPSFSTPSCPYLSTPLPQVVTVFFIRLMVKFAQIFFRKLMQKFVLRMVNWFSKNSVAVRNPFIRFSVMRRTARSPFLPSFQQLPLSTLFFSQFESSPPFPILSPPFFEDGGKSDNFSRLLLPFSPFSSSPPVYPHPRLFGGWWDAAWRRRRRREAVLIFVPPPFHPPPPSFSISEEKV